MRRLFFLLIIFGILAGVVIYFFRAPYFRVKNMEIDGLSGSVREQVLREVSGLILGNAALVFPRDNMFILSTDKLAENLGQKLLGIKDFAVSREWPTGLKISGRERSTWAIYCKDSCFLMDYEGRLFSSAPDFQGNLLLKVYDERNGMLNAGDFVLNRDNFLAMAEFIAQLEHDLNGHISRIVLKESGAKEFYLKDWYVLTDDSVNYKTARNNLNLALPEIGDKSASLEYIDLRFSNKIFYKLK